jgi:hypothetical protein
MSHNSEHSSKHSSRNRVSKHGSRINNKEICIDNLFPTDNKSGTKGRKLDVETLFSGTPLNNEPDITFTSDLLIERIKKRRLEKLLCYNNMLKYCHNRITATDEDQGTDIIFSVVESVPECKDYNPKECLEYISVKLREDDFDTTVLTDTTMFITWRYLELKKEDRLQNGNLEKDEPNKKSDSSYIYDVGQNISTLSCTVSPTAPLILNNQNKTEQSRKTTKDIIINKSPSILQDF